MLRSRSPKRLWNYLGKLCSAYRRLTATGHPSLQGRNNHELVHGWTFDISAYVMHEWYEVVQFRDHDGETKLACWLGPAEDTGGGDAAWLLPSTARPTVRSTFWSLTTTERTDKADEIKSLLDDINSKIGDEISQADVDPAIGTIMPDPQAFDLFINGDGQEIIHIDDDLKVPDSDDYTPEALDRYLSAEVMINRDGDLIRGTVVSRCKDLNGIPVGKEDSNPILDTREYIVDFEDGSKEV